MEILITGYQYSDTKRFTSVYKFPQHKDQDPIHLPPNTTLIVPPVMPEGKEALWDGKGWDLVDEEIITSTPNGN